MDVEKVFEQATAGLSEVPENWMSGTGARYLMMDPCILWLNFHGERHGFKKDDERSSFLEWIGPLGHAFEKAWVEQCAPGAIQLMEHDYDVRQLANVRKTLEAMNADHDVLWKAALAWAPDRLFGAADLVVKNTWLYEHFPSVQPSEPEPDHYIICDAKFSSRLDSSDKRKDLEVNSAQLKYYSHILGELQGYAPKTAYLLTRDKPLSPLAVDVSRELHSPLDPELARMRDLHIEIKLNGGDKYLPWRDSIVAPSPDNKKDEPWHGAKKIILHERLPVRPLEFLPNIGHTRAELLRDHGYRDIEHLLGIDFKTEDFERIKGIGKAVARRLNTVLTVNKPGGKATPIPASLVPRRHKVEIVCDLEYLSNCHVTDFSDIQSLPGIPMLFMIGCGFEENGKWEYKQFVAAREDYEAECEMLDQFEAFLDKMGVFSHPGNSALYHWSPAERWQMKGAAERHGLGRLSALPWYDLEPILDAGEIAIPGQWRNGLKEVVRALGDYAPEYSAKWGDECGGGQAAQVMGWRMYESDQPYGTEEHRLLTTYLEADVFGTFQILKWMRVEAKDVPVPQSKPKPKPKRKSRRKASSWYSGLLEEAENSPLRNGWYSSALCREHINM
jgi:hypothetical protein